MDKEQIENEAASYVEDILGLYYIGEAEAERAFIAGASWRINSVWHPNTEMPNIGIDVYGSGKDCVVQPKYGLIEIGEAIFDDGIYAISCNREIYTMDEIERWAYVEDLLPTKETE